MVEADPIDAIEFDRSVIGVNYDVGTHEVTEQQVAAFAQAIGETNPLYLSPEAAKNGPHGVLIAPPTYYTSIHLQPGPDPKIVFGTAGFNASQHCSFYEPMCVGDTIRAQEQISRVFAKTGRTGTLVFAVRQTTYINQHGRIVIMVESSNVRRDMNQ